MFHVQCSLMGTPVCQTGNEPLQFSGDQTAVCPQDGTHTLAALRSAGQHGTLY